MIDRINTEQKFWNGFAGKYDRFIKRTAEAEYKQLIKMIVEDAKNSINLLEIGAGTGILSLDLSNFIPSITATDLSQKMIDIAADKAEKKSVRNISFSVEDVCALRFPDNSFDTVVASNVMHLLFEPDIAIREIQRVIRPRGSVIIPTYCHGDSILSFVISNLIGMSGFKARSKWSVDSFKRFIQKNGFKISKSMVIKGVIPMLYLVAIKTK